MDTPIAYRRIYGQPARSDGVRVLVDRVWPRGIRKQDAHLDDWLREVAPSTELRQWYGHRRERFAEFRRRYLAGLQDPRRQEPAQHLRSLARTQDLTLLTATRDVEHSQAAVLVEWLGHDRSRSTRLTPWWEADQVGRRAPRDPHPGWAPLRSAVRALSTPLRRPSVGPERTST